MRLWDKEIYAIYKPIIEEFLLKHNNVLQRTAFDLGISVEYLTELIERCGIEKGERLKMIEIMRPSYALSSISKDKIREMIKYYYKKNNENQSKTAIELGVNVKTLRSKMAYYEVGNE